MTRRSTFSLDRKLSREEIAELELRRYTGPVDIIRSDKDVTHALRDIRREHLLGFDTETRPSFKKGEHYPPSLLQLATRKKVYVFQLAPLDRPEELFNVLTDRKTIKSGVAVADDIKGLQEVAHFEPASFLDLGNLARRLKMHHHGLRGLAALLLGFRLSKSRRTYNWSLPRLRSSAVRYAASDAWVSRELYLAMHERGCIEKRLPTIDH